LGRETSSTCEVEQKLP